MENPDWTKPMQRKSSKRSVRIFKALGPTGVRPYVAYSIFEGLTSHLINGKINEFAGHPNDLENVPEPEVAKPLSDEQMGWMVGKWVQAKELLSLVVRYNRQTKEISIVNATNGYTCRQVAKYYTWPNGDFIDSEHPPTKPDYELQHERLGDCR